MGQYRKACTKHGIFPDLTGIPGRPRAGTTRVLQTAERISRGAHGRGYNGVCPTELDGPFLEAYESGRQLYNLRARVNNAANQINSMRAESDRIDADLVSVGTQMMNSSLTKEQRAQLLIDTKHMAERKGEIKATPAATRERSADVPARAR